MVEITKDDFISIGTGQQVRATYVSLGEGRYSEKPKEILKKDRLSDCNVKKGSE